MAVNPYFLMAYSPGMTANELAATSATNDTVRVRRNVLLTQALGHRASKRLRRELCDVRNTHWAIMEPLLRQRRLDELVAHVGNMVAEQWRAAVEPRATLLDQFNFTRRQETLRRKFLTLNGGARALARLCDSGYRNFVPALFVNAARHLDAHVTQFASMLPLFDRIPGLAQRLLDLRRDYETPLAPLPCRVVYFHIVRPLMLEFPDAFEDPNDIQEYYKDVLRVVFTLFDTWTSANVVDVLVHVDFEAFARKPFIDNYIKHITAVAVLRRRYRRGLIAVGTFRQAVNLKAIFNFWFGGTPARPWPPTLLELYAQFFARIPNDENHREMRQCLSSLFVLEQSGQFRFRHVRHDAVKSWLRFTNGKDVSVLLDTGSLGPRALAETTARLAGDPALVAAIYAALDSIEVDAPLYRYVETEVPGAWANVPFPLPESLADVPTIVAREGDEKR